jgi:hypothetical protein
MSGDVSDRKRLISITGGNLRNNHLYISGHHDFFPDECYGPSTAKKGTGREVKLVVEGLANPVETDIARDGGKGRPRNFFRKRAWVGRFFEKHDLQEGDVIAFEKLDKFTYRVYPFESKNVREGAAMPDHWPTVNTKEPTAVDLFAGCGGLWVNATETG